MKSKNSNHSQELKLLIAVVSGVVSGFLFVGLIAGAMFVGNLL